MAALTKNKLQDHLIQTFSKNVARLYIDEAFRPGRLVINVHPREEIDCTTDELVQAIETESRLHIQSNVLSEIRLLEVQ